MWDEDFSQVNFKRRIKKIKKCDSLFIENRKQASTDINLKMNLFRKYIFFGGAPGF